MSELDYDDEDVKRWPDCRVPGCPHKADFRSRDGLCCVHRLAALRRPAASERERLRMAPREESA
jgi:hypothetical protein